MRGNVREKLKIQVKVCDNPEASTFVRTVVPAIGYSQCPPVLVVFISKPSSAV